jgi:hypothetical protein
MAAACGLGATSAWGQAASPEEKVKVGAGCVCAHPRGIFRDECKRKDLTCPVPAADVTKLTDFVQYREERYSSPQVSPQVAYSRLKFTFTAAPELTEALSKKDNFFQRFRPRSRGLIISVAAKAGALELLPTTPMLAIQLPAPGADGDTRTYTTRQEVYSAWIRVDSATALTPTIAFESVSDATFTGMDSVLSTVAALYTSVTGDQILASVSNAVLSQRAQEIDRQIEWLVDPDGRDTRRFEGDGLSISPASGERRALIFDMRDAQNPEIKLATLRVEAELIPSMLLPAPKAEAADLELRPVASATKMRNVQGVATASGPKAFSIQPQYGKLRSDMQAAGATPAMITAHCQAFSAEAIDGWRLVPVDADLLIFEALEDAAQLVSGAAAGTLAQNRCFTTEQEDQLKRVGRIVQRTAVANPLSVIDMNNLGAALRQGGTLPASTAAKFADQVEVVSLDESYGFLGSSVVTKAEALEVIALAGPKRFCCYNGQVIGRWTMGLDTADEGAGARPLAIDFITVTEPKIERIVLRAPTSAEQAVMLGTWSTPAPASQARVAGTATNLASAGAP